MIDSVLSFLSLALSGIVLGWIFFDNEKPLPPLTEPTPWKHGAEKSPIAKWAVSSDGIMYNIITEDKKHIVFFDKSDGKNKNMLILDVGDNNDIPRISFSVRIAPPRYVETEMTIHARTRKQFDDLKVPEKEMYRYLLEKSLETV